MIQEETKVVAIDRAEVHPIIAKALSGKRSINTKGMDKILWLAIRAVLGIGGSDVAPALGISKYKTSYQLWKEKVADEVEIIENKYTIWGNLLEEPIAQEYMRKTGRMVVADDKIRIHPKYDRLFVNLDRVVMEDGEEKGLLECKSTVRRVYESWADDSENCVQGIPLYMYCQVQHELSVSDLPYADLAIGIIDEREVEIKRIERDEEYIEKQNTALAGWWNAYVEPNVAPPKTAAEYSFVDPIGESAIEATAEISDAWNELIGLKEEQKALKNKIDGVEDKIKEYMGENENLTLFDKVIASWKSVNRKGYVVEPTTFRMFRIKKIKE